MANYFRNENFEILKTRNLYNIITYSLIASIKTYILILQLIFLFSEFSYLYLVSFF